MRRTSRALVTYLLVFAFLLGQVPASFANKPGPPVGKVIQAEPEPVATVSVGPAVTRTASKDPVTETLAFSKSWSKASNVVIVQSGDWRSAMQASALAGALKAPVIATSSKGLSKSTVSRLKSMKVKTAYLIGTKKALPTGITKKLTSMRIKSTRLTGKNVYDQGRTVARKVKSITKTTPIAIVVNETD